MEPQEPPGQFLTVTARLALPGIPAATHTNTQNTMSTTTAALCRRRTLKVISSRPVLITICTLVVIECACVLAELMVDLQGIKFRFENEEKELNRFVTFLIEKYPAEFATWTDSRSVEDVVNRIKDSLVVRSDKDIASAVLAACPCSCPPQTQSSDTVPSAVAGEYSERGKSANYGAQQGGDAAAASGASANSPARTTRQAYNNGSTSGVTAYAQFNPADVFVLEVNNVKESFFLVAEYVPDHIKLNETKHYHYETEYDKIHKASTALHIASLVILSVMVIETIIKFVCMGTAFLKKKFEVFDAFIVISSFALDFVFLDSRWYETGKDAATILVLMLPWRVVRIVNSFLMTVKHKHHIEIMTIKRAKKRADFKNAKLQTLLTEIRKDVNLLVALCRNSHVPESDIYACLYGLGRRSQTLNAVTSCTTIMLVSALGKDASVEDEIYGRLFADALRDPAEQDSEPEAKKLAEEAIDAAIQLDEQLEQQHKKAAKNSLRPRLLPKRAGRGQVTRSYTVPRRSASIDDNIETSTANAGSASPGGGSNVFYVNDAFATHRASEKAKKRHAVSSPETLAGLAGDSSGGGGSCSGGSGTSPCLPVAEEESCEGKGEGAETVSLGGGGAGAKDSWEGRLPPKCKSKASVRSLPGPGPGQNFVTFEVTTQVTYL